MPRKSVKLTWFEPTKQWRKYRKGVTHYLDPKGVKKTSIEAKLQAWDQWTRLLVELEAKEATPVVAMANDYNALSYAPPTATATTLQGATISDLLATFLAEKRQESESGERSIQTYREHKDKLDDFQAFARDRLKISKASEITGMGIQDYRNTQLHLLTLKKAKGGRSPVTIKKRLACLKQFLEWCWKMEAIPTLPRNVDRKFAKVMLPEPKPKSFTIPEIKKLLAAAEGQTKLFILLGLNCGYNPTCIASLKHEHVKWSDAEIDRPRHKTNGRQRHVLWRDTMKLLKEFTTDPDKSQPGRGLVLLSKRGTPLVQERITDKGKTIRTDLVGRQFTRLCEANKMVGTNRGFKVLRSTSAEHIKEIADPNTASVFLAHTEKATRRFYVTPDYTPLFDALDKLAKLYGVK